MGYRDMLVAFNSIKEPQDLGKVMNNIMYNPNNNVKEPRINTIAFTLAVDKEKVLLNGTVDVKDSARIVNQLVWRMPNDNIYQVNGNDTVMVVSKAYIAMMDILANNDWKRPIYYVSTTGSESFFGLDKYFQVEGLAYRLVPVEPYAVEQRGFLYGRVNSDILYHNVMNKFDFSEFANPKVFLSEDYTRTVQNLKIFLFRLAEALVLENNLGKAEKVMDKYYTWFPKQSIPYDFLDFYMAETYIKFDNKNGISKGITVYSDYIDQLNLETEYYLKFRGKHAEVVKGNLDRNKSILNQIANNLTHYSSLYPDFADNFKTLSAKASLHL